MIYVNPFTGEFIVNSYFERCPRDEEGRCKASSSPSVHTGGIGKALADVEYHDLLKEEPHLHPDSILTGAVEATKAADRRVRGHRGRGRIVTLKDMEDQSEELMTDKALKQFKIKAKEYQRKISHRPTRTGLPVRLPPRKPGGHR